MCCGIETISRHVGLCESQGSHYEIMKVLLRAWGKTKENSMGWDCMGDVSMNLIVQI